MSPPGLAQQFDYDDFEAEFMQQAAAAAAGGKDDFQLKSNANAPKLTVAKMNTGLSMRNTMKNPPKLLRV